MTYLTLRQVQRKDYFRVFEVWWRIMKAVRYASITHRYSITWLSVRKRNGISTQVWRRIRSHYAALGWWRVSFVSIFAILKHPSSSTEMYPISKNASMRESIPDYYIPVVIGHHIYEMFLILTNYYLNSTISCMDNYYIGSKSLVSLKLCMHALRHHYWVP